MAECNQEVVKCPILSVFDGLHRWVQMMVKVKLLNPVLKAFFPYTVQLSRLYYGSFMWLNCLHHCDW